MLINKLSTRWLQWDLVLPGTEGMTWIPFFLPTSFLLLLLRWLPPSLPFSPLQMFITPGTSGPAFISEPIQVNEKNECRDQTSYFCAPWGALGEVDLRPRRVDSNSARVAQPGAELLGSGRWRVSWALGREQGSPPVQWEEGHRHTCRATVVRKGTPLLPPVYFCLLVFLCFSFCCSLLKTLPLVNFNTVTLGARKMRIWMLCYPYAMLWCGVLYVSSDQVIIY